MSATISIYSLVTIIVISLLLITLFPMLLLNDTAFNVLSLAVMIAIFIVLFVNTLFLKRGLKTYDEENNKYLNTLYFTSMISFILVTILLITLGVKFAMAHTNIKPPSWGTNP